jgi:hypothetical protein
MRPSSLSSGPELAIAAGSAVNEPADFAAHAGRGADLAETDAIAARHRLFR